jgi:hypothetical protein
MSMTKCKECSNEISTEAESCPKCGAKIARTSLFTKLVAIFIAVPLLIGIFNSSSHQSSSTALTPAQQAEKIKQDAAIQRATTGAVLLKKSMRNPDSFKLESAMVVDGTEAVCYDYRAQNGFGGMNSEHAVLSRDGKQFKTSTTDGFNSLWNKECGNKKGQEFATAIKWLAL